jgi:uncharacterized membrane protein YgdD (TMEM256/DUF423 family)
VGHDRTFAAGALLAGIGVACGAFGAHALRERLEAAETLELWHTAVRYQVWHGLALLSVGFLRERRPVPVAVSWLLGVGAVLFSGSLYGLALGFLRSVLGPVTPLGGLCLLAGWTLLAVAAWRTPRSA